jgi:hypothetical protein
MSTYETIFTLYAAVTLPLFALDFYRSGFKKAIKGVFWPITLPLVVLFILFCGILCIAGIVVFVKNINNPDTRVSTFEKTQNVLDGLKVRYTNKD